jgi:chromosome segregation ATPase
MSAAFNDIDALDEQIDQLEAEIDRTGEHCSALIREQADLGGRIREGFARMAHVQAMALEGPDARPQDDMAQDVLPSLARRQGRIDQLREHLAALQRELGAATAAATALQQQRAADEQRLQALCDAVDAGLQAQPAYQHLLAALGAAEDKVGTAERIAASAHAERAAKAAAYEADAILMYLLSRGFGGAMYRAWPLTRTIDGWLAQLCGFDKASREYGVLTELPGYLDKHVRATRTSAEEADERVQKVRRPALVEAGVAPVENGLQALQARLATALLDVQLQRTAVEAQQAELEAFTAWTDPEGVAIIQALAVALSNESSDRLDQRVAGTVSDEDDRCLDEVRQLRMRMDTVAAQIGDRQRQMSEGRERLGHLKAVRREHQAAADALALAAAREYRALANRARPRATASRSVMSGLLGVGAGAASTAWASTPRTSAPASAPARSNAGGVGNGGGAGSGGFRTGGGF